MKRKQIVRIDYCGPEDHTWFAHYFKQQMLVALKARGLLTQAQYMKGLSLLRAGK